MVSREHKRGSSIREEFQLLRSITNSKAESETSIIADASKYIKKLKQKVEKINNGSTSKQHFSDHTDHVVKVKTLKKGYMIEIMSRKNMLVCVLEAFEDIGLDIVEASVSCANTFSFHAISSSKNGDQCMDAEAVKQAVAEAIRTWSKHDAKC
ncbi:unnamed protein product [Cochlearia groenlandica]